MITPKEAEALAQAAMQSYVKDCKCANQEEVANALMKLASMCGLGMCAVVGRNEAVDRLIGTANHIARTQAGVNWNMERAN